MPKPPRYLKQLEHELLALGDDAMLLEELDGFIAGLLVCPELIKPSEWLPVVWGSEGEDDPAFDSLDHLNRVLGLVMEHYNDVARTLIERPDRYGPRFAVDKRHNEILWEIWVAGFEKAVKLRPPAWQKLLTADHETAQAMSGLLTLADVDRRDSRFTSEQLDGLTAAAPHQIGPWVVTLNEWRLVPKIRANAAFVGGLRAPSRPCRGLPAQGREADRGAEQGPPAGRSGRVVAIDDPGVRLVPEDGELAIELVGELAGILALTNEKSPRPLGPGAGQLTLVAGARNCLDLLLVG